MQNDRVCPPLSINGPNLNSSSEPRCASGPHLLLYSLSAMRTIKAKQNLEINPSVSESSSSRSHSHLHAVSRQPGKPWVITREILISTFFPDPALSHCPPSLSSNLFVLLGKNFLPVSLSSNRLWMPHMKPEGPFSTFPFRLRAAVLDFDGPPESSRWSLECHSHGRAVRGIGDAYRHGNMTGGKKKKSCPADV